MSEAPALRDSTVQYVVVVTCVVLRYEKNGELQVLILKRSNDESEGPGLWTIPGGKVIKKDWGEGTQNTNTHTVWVGMLERAIKREIKEETCIAVRRAYLLPGREKVFLRKDGTPTLVVTFVAPCTRRTKVKLGKESTAYAWIPLEHLKRYTFIGNVQDDIRFASKL